LTTSQVHELFTSLTERTTGLPGVEAVAFASGVPFGAGCDASVQDPRTKELVPVTMYEVSDSFFETLRIPLLAGRTFTGTDAGRNVLILNEAASERFWPGKNPIGETLGRSEVIGIVRNLGNLQSRSQAGVYVLLEPPSRCKNLLVIRHAGDPKALSGELIQVARRLDRRFAPSVARYDEVLAQASESADVAARVAGVLGILALVLACVGIYGVASFGVSQQTRELGVRAAIGAQPLAILMMVLKQNLRTVMIGGCVGLVGAVAFGQLLTSLLHGVSPADPLALAMTCVVLLTASTLAAGGPAYRASRVDPAITLRDD
jgi:hypothetical protein